MTMAETMEAWVRDKSRTVEERFGVEAIVEEVERIFFAQNGWAAEETWEQRSERRKRRRLNPAYRPQINFAVLVHRVGAIAGKITALCLSSDGDRPLHDISFLQF